MTLAEQKILDFIQQGGFQIDEQGRIWRVQTLTRTGKMKSIEPRLADRQHISGYCDVFLGRKHCAKSHRIVWIASNGPIPDGLEINHKNGIKSDNRLINLELMTPHDNMLHSFQALGRWRPVGEKNGRSKLTFSDVVTIRKMSSDGISQRKIARQFGVSHTMVKQIVKGRAWRNEFPA